MHRGYHNMTARYNGYFNGKESWLEALEEIEEEHEEDYYDVLPVHIYGTKKEISRIMNETDRCIEKGSLVIERHSMVFKKKEYCRWVDDSYMLIGKARFLRQEYEDAKTTFEYVAREYDYNEIRFDAKLWLAKTYIESGKKDKAFSFLDVLESDEEFPKRLKGELYTSYAHAYVKSEQYEPAVEKVKKALEHVRKRKMKIRLRYILAQLYKETGESQLASEEFAKVIKMNPEYEMAFYAKINRALSADEFTGDSQAIKKMLEKMLKDEKNEDYFDQIYYALAEMEFKEGNEEKGLEYMKLSAAASRDNDLQRSKSLLRVAEIYYQNRNYRLSGLYYDSTVAILKKSDKKYREVVKRKKYLSDLVEELAEVDKQDSLQQLAKLSSREQKKIVDKIIRELEASESQKGSEEEGGRQQLTQRDQRRNVNRAGGTGWYFYNPQNISFGFSQFKKTWGDRKLADDWRRSNKNTSLSDFDEPVEDTSATASEEEEEALKDLKNPDYYLKQIPNDEETLAKSNSKIEAAFFNAGIILKDKIQDYPEAIKMFESIVRRNKNSEMALPAYFQLYRINLLLENEKDAKYYRYIITNQYPDSEYAKVILDPNYKRGEDQKHSKEERDYNRTYNTFAFSQFSQVIKQCDKVIASEPDNHLLSKYYLLRALSYGNQKEMPAFKAALTEILKLFPKGSEAKEAKRLLDLLKKRGLGEEEFTERGKGEYAASNSAPHSFLFVFPKAVSKRKFLVAISDFNQKFFKRSNLKIEDSFLGDANRMIIVKSFKNKEEAMEYYSTFVSNDKQLKELNQAGFSRFAVSTDNFKSLFETHDLEGYLVFFEENYIQ